MQIHLIRSSALFLNRIKSQIPSLVRFKWTTKEPLIVLVFRGVSLQMAILPSGCCFLIVHSSSLSRFVMIKYMENRHLLYITVGAWRQVNLFCCKQRAARRLPISCTRHRRFSRVAAGGAPFTNLYSPRTICALLCGTNNSIRSSQIYVTSCQQSVSHRHQTSVHRWNCKRVPF